MGGFRRQGCLGGRRRPLPVRVEPVDAVLEYRMNAARWPRSDAAHGARRFQPIVAKALTRRSTHRQAR